MWKKNEPENTAVGETPAPQKSAAAPSRSESSVLGQSLFVKGDITGTQDIVIRGKVEGTVKMKDNTVTVGEGGQVKADIYGKAVIVEGDLHGNLFGGEKIIVKASGRVHGNISAPRVTLEDGARFKGSIDMEGPREEKNAGVASTSTSTGATEKKPDSGGSDSASAVASVKKPEKTNPLSINSPSANR